MSAIQKAIIKACDIDAPEKDETRQEFIKRAIKAINKLEDPQYEQLSKDVVSWFNSAADVADANKKSGKSEPLPEFPDFEADDARPSRRRGEDAKDGASAETIIKIGTEVTVIKKNGREVTGKLVERDKNGVVLEVDGKDREIDFDDIGSIEQVNGAGKPGSGEEVVEGPKVGDLVDLVTKRGRKETGEVLELDDKVIVLKTAEEPKGEEFNIDRVESVKVVSGKKAAAVKNDDGAAPSGRSSRRSDAGDAANEKPPRTVNKNGVSVGRRIKELMAADPDMDEKDVIKALTKEDIEFKEVTVSMNFKENHTLIALLRENKKLK